MLRLKKKIAHSPSISPLHFSGDTACYNTEKPHESVGACGEIIDIHPPIAPESLVSNDTFAEEINGPKVAFSPSEKLSLPPRIVSFTINNAKNLLYIPNPTVSSYSTNNIGSLELLTIQDS